MAQIKKVGILGPGAVGGLLSGLITRAGYDVVCIGIAETVDDIKKNGIKIESPTFGTFIAKPEAEEYLSRDLDVLFVTVKSPDLAEALCRLSSKKIGMVVLLLNGLGHRELVRKEIATHVIVGTIGSVELAKEGGVVRQLSKQHPHIEMASTEVPFSHLDDVKRMLEDSGISVTLLKREEEVIWNKLVRLCSIAAMTAVTSRSIGEIRMDHVLRQNLAELIGEATLVAGKNGVTIDANRVLDDIDRLPHELTTSLARDISMHRVSEVESIIGEVVREGEKHGVSVTNFIRVYEDLKSRK